MIVSPPVESNLLIYSPFSTNPESFSSFISVRYTVHIGPATLLLDTFSILQHNVKNAKYNKTIYTFRMIKGFCKIVGFLYVLQFDFYFRSVTRKSKSEFWIRLKIKKQLYNSFGCLCRILMDNDFQNSHSIYGAQCVSYCIDPLCL